MYEKITKYAEIFGGSAGAPENLPEKIQAFIADFSQSEWMNPDGMQVVGERGWATRSALRNDIPSMTAEEVCACLSAFVQQEAFLEGIILDLVQQGILPQMLQRLQELDS